MANRKRIALSCDVCGARNYKTTKSIQGSQAESGKRLKLKKFCPACQHHTWHSETK